MIQIQQKGYFNSTAQFHIFEDKTLGTGSFGVVKLACHVRASKLYAIKIVNLNIFQQEPQISKILERENNIHNKLEHPHIVKLWDSFIQDGKLYMVMQYLQKGTLFHHQNTYRRFTEPEAFKYFYQSLQALKYLHSRRIIHRDLKPQNLLLDSDYNLKLCDFGWATFMVQGKRNTFCGTYEYMAPEIVFQKNYDQKVDIWALGILLYELLHGYAPFMADVLPQLKQKMWEGSFQISQNLSQQCTNLINLILKFDQYQRITIQQIEVHPWIQKMQSYILYNYKINRNQQQDAPQHHNTRQKVSKSTKTIQRSPFKTIQHYRCGQIVKNNSSPCLQLISNDHINDLHRLISYKELRNISTNNTVSIKKVKQPLNIVMNSPNGKGIKVKNKVTPEITAFQTKNYGEDFQVSEKQTAKRRRNQNIFIKNYQVDPQSTPLLIKKKKNKMNKNTNSPNFPKRSAVSINEFKIQTKKILGNSKSKSKSKERSNQKDKSKSKDKSKDKQKSKTMKIDKLFDPLMYRTNKYRIESPLALTPTYKQRKRIL